MDSIPLEVVYKNMYSEYPEIRKAKTMLSLISRTTVASVRENGSRPICLLTVLIKH